MRKENPKELSLLTFMSTQSNKDKRAELTPVKNKTAFSDINLIQQHLPKAMILIQNTYLMKLQF
ncbi:hypothetical protein BANRA_02789 [Klebsiella pneumoniae]|uniref:hypothetical protein n=1 Tax=Klebsiella pneumoniae TaxID=573 RepID=UPI000F2D2A24|nr:hypothetical protein [Klebsiella pneumoniae]VCW02415.1 hypothetical protein BANRA_02789 [Klebsiella pneumoniae]